MCSVTICIQLVGHLSPLPPLWFLLDTQTSSATQCCLITMRWITLPITATQSDFHDPVGAACSRLSRNYSPRTYRKPSSAAQPLAVTLMDWQTRVHEWTHTLTWRGNLHKYAEQYVWYKGTYMCVCTFVWNAVYALTTLQIYLNLSLHCLHADGDFITSMLCLTSHHNAFMTTHTSNAPI